MRPLFVRVQNCADITIAAGNDGEAAAAAAAITVKGPPTRNYMVRPPGPQTNISAWVFLPGVLTWTTFRGERRSPQPAWCCEQELQHPRPCRELKK